MKIECFCAHFWYYLSTTCFPARAAVIKTKYAMIIFLKFPFLSNKFQTPPYFDIPTALTQKTFAKLRKKFFEYE